MSEKLLVLDLDETLIYATEFPGEREPDLNIGPSHVWKRPGVEQFLSTCLDRFQVGIWTSATKDYTDVVLDHLLPDPARLSFVSTRKECEKRVHPETGDRFWVKDLGKLIRFGYDAASILVVDDTPESWFGYSSRVIQISKFRGDPEDTELDLLIRFLAQVCSVKEIGESAIQRWRDFTHRRF